MNKLIIEFSDLPAPLALTYAAHCLRQGTPDGERMQYPPMYRFGDSGVVVKVQRLLKSDKVTVSKEATCTQHES